MNINGNDGDLTTIATARAWLAGDGSGLLALTWDMPDWENVITLAERTADKLTDQELRALLLPGSEAEVTAERYEAAQRLADARLSNAQNALITQMFGGGPAV